MKIDIKPSLDGQWFWRIRGKNGEAILVSETYTRKSSALRAAKKFVKAIKGITDENFRIWD